MSDLYLILRSRLDLVTSWVDLGSEVMLSARQARGLSREAVARQANISSKTYERYEDRGRVPASQLHRFADILGLEIERQPAPTVTIETDVTLETLQAEVRVLTRKLDRALHLLEQLLDEDDQPESGSAA